MPLKKLVRTGRVIVKKKKSVFGVRWITREEPKQHSTVMRRLKRVNQTKGEKTNGLQIALISNVKREARFSENKKRQKEPCVRIAV